MKSYRSILSAVLFLAIVVAVPSLAAQGEPAKAPGVVNINTADVADLALLPRVGPTLAARILAFRDENGPFKNTEDLILVRGIGEKTFALMEPFVTLDGETTLTEKVRPSRLTLEADGR